MQTQDQPDGTGRAEVVAAQLRAYVEAVTDHVEAHLEPQLQTPQSSDGNAGADGKDSPSRDVW
jgi:hypothetical protein